jgi:hypothetical protein
MTKADPVAAHKERMKELHALFTKKTQYHHQKAYVELKDIYWLVHEFFSAFLDNSKHWTEEEILHELKNFKHDFVVLPTELTAAWHDFIKRLSEYQYAGREPSQDELRTLLTQFGSLVDQTVGRELVPHDAFTRHIQAAKILLVNGDIDGAEAAYRSLMQEYDGFDADRKRGHYEQLERLYESIAAARNALPGIRR